MILPLGSSISFYLFTFANIYPPTYESIIDLQNA